MKPLLVATCVLAACSNRPPTKQFHTGIDASVLNGFWTADERNDAGRVLGIVIFDLPDGPRWSPHGFHIEKSFVYLTHDCRDYEVESGTGQVRPVHGINPLGRVLYPEDAGTSASLLWDATTRDWWAVLAPEYSGTATVLSVAFDGGAVARSATELLLSYEMTYYLSLPNGMSPPDGSVITDVVATSMVLRRASSCP